MEGGCQAGAAQFPGDSECQPLGTACPASEEEIRTLAALPADTPLHRVAPASVARVLRSLAPGPAILALSEGSFPARLQVPEGVDVALVGACVVRTSLTSEGRGDFLLRVATGRRVSLANLQVPPGSWGLRVFSGGVLTLRDVLLDGISGGAALGALNGGAIELERVVIRDTQMFDGFDSPAVVGLDGTRTRAVDVELIGGSAVGALFDGEGGEAPAVAQLERIAIRRLELALTVESAQNVLPPPVMGGVVALGNAQVQVRNAHLEDCQGVGFQAGREVPGDVVGQLSVTDAFVDRQTAGLHLRWGWAAAARRGGELALDRFVGQSFQEAGIVASGNEAFGGGALQMADVVLRAGRPTRPTQVGFGLALFGGADVQGERVVVDQALGWGISVAPAFPDPIVDLTDLVIRRTADSGETGTRAGAADGGGIISEGFNQLSLRRALIEDVSSYGLALYGSDLTAFDLEVRGVHRDSCGEIPDDVPGGCRSPDGVVYSGGTALVAAQGASVEIERFRLAGGELAGLQIAGGSILTAHAGVVTENGIGVNAPPPADPARWFTDVFVFDNDEDVTVVALPVPEPKLGLLADDD